MLFRSCAKEPPPRTVAEFLDNRILLEATMVRCGKNRNMSKYEVDCVNAREAINRIATIDEKERRAELEAQSARKRKALRRTQEAAAEARRRAAEALASTGSVQWTPIGHSPPRRGGSLLLPLPVAPRHDEPRLPRVQRGPVLPMSVPSGVASKQTETGRAPRREGG